MAQDFAKSFYNSKAWRECRASFIAKRVAIDGGLCQTCGSVTGNLGYIVHHDKMWLTPENISDPMVALNHSNLKYDCLTCHNQEKEGKEAEKPRYFFGEHGEIILIPPVKDELILPPY
jgi:5-methylcytosine-specific restriction enzyme A